MNERELALRRALSIPDDASQVLVFEQSAHCDWDWVATFKQYYACGGGTHQAVSKTLQEALDSIDSTSGYTYVYCEVAYLQAFMNDANVPQSAKDALTTYAGSSFLFSSGGISSAENLTLHTEAFIRNYLIGRQWLMATFGVTASNQMWIPDDFGHDAQLPVLLQAMGFTGAGFWRIPAQAGAPGTSCVSASANAASSFLDQSIGLDFTWQANDNSQVQAHWLSNSYLEGNGFGDYSGTGAGGGTIPTSVGNAKIQSLIDAQSTTAIENPAYMFVPIDYDFTAPYTNLPTIVANWNADPTTSGVYVAMGSFDCFMQLVAAAGAPPLISPSNTSYPFIPHPYYSGCYGSKPLLKSTHYQTARTLLFTEAMQLVLQAIGSAAAPGALTQLAQAWAGLMPSTHHDYITGTAPNTASPTITPCLADKTQDVYDDEQVPFLQQALAAAQAVQSDVLGAIAAALPAGADIVVVFNPLGFGRTAVADLASPPAGSFQSSTADSQNFVPVQDDGNGGLLVQATVPSLGYTTATLSTTAPNQATGLSASQPVANGPVTMTNASISAVIDTTGITSLTNPNSTSGTNYLDSTAGLVFYEDAGNIYRFGMEIPCDGLSTFQPDATMTLESPTITLTETGSLRTTAVATGTVNGTPWTITYQLYATDTALRITVDGAAPSGYSVMWRFPFLTPATSLTYGTTSHWDTQSPRNFFEWTPPKGTDLMTFEPTHEFVGAIGMDSYLGAIYHYATPGWAIDTSGAVIGCLLRNTPGTQNAASGIDPDAHAVSFAVALPVGLESPANGAWSSGSMLAAALDINNPLAAATVPPSATAVLPSSMSIASTTDASALVTVAKAGTVNPSQMILRLYQPSNSALSSVEVTLDATIAALYQSGGSLVASAATAIEQPSDDTLNLSTTATTVTLDLPYAITTVALG
ncbi:MAG TPA: hypothetical protein VN380_21470 [Thermoanaerobaculia bacterium]|nr:hypothetical protein [Thermoanaerobaculia bacterium]